MRAVLTAIGTVAAALAIGAPAASADQNAPEPNENIAGAAGITSSDNYVGSFGSASDVDWFVFSANSGTSPTVTVTKSDAGCSPSIDWNVLDANGNDVSPGAHSTASTQSDTETLSAPSGGRFYIRLSDDCAGDAYTVKVGPNGAVASAVAVDDTTPSSVASPTYDQNEDIAHAMPLAGATAYTGDFSSAADSDWYSFNASRAGPVRAVVTKLGAGCSGDVAWNVLDADGNPVIPAVRSTTNDTVGIAYFNAPGPGRYYLVLGDDCAGDPYQVRVGPPEAISTDPAFAVLAPTPTPQVTQEPNETAATAYGPLSTSVQYGGVISSATDVDLFYLFAAAGKPIELTLTKVGPGCGPRLAVAVQNAAGKVIASGAAASNTSTHVAFSVPVAQQVFFRVAGTCAGDSYQMHILPNGSLLGQFPKPVQQSTTKAKKTVNKAKISLKHKTSHVYSGKLVTVPRCAAGRKVTLRWVTHAKKSYGRATTKSDGTYKITAKRTITGKVYVYTPRFENRARICQSATSRKVRVR